MLPKLLYYAFFIPLTMICIFAFYYRYGFERAGLKSAFKRCVLWTIPSICLLIFGVFRIIVPADGGPSAPGEGLLVMIMIFMGLIITTIIAYVAFISGYIKAIPEGYTSRTKIINYYMVFLGVACLFILISGALIVA